jgi:hypothetical protein
VRRSATIANQLPSLFDQSTGETLATAGMELARETADKKVKDWSKLCWQLFLVWIRRMPRYHEFMMEDFRNYLYQYDLIERPPSERAFGFISRRASKENWIGHAGIAKVKNKKAHATPANVWFKK